MSEHNDHVYFVNQLYRDFLLPTILGGDTPGDSLLGRQADHPQI